MRTEKQLANLKKNSDLTPKERKERARKAGLASVKARRERKTLKEGLIALLKMPMKEGRLNEDSVTSMDGFKGQGVNVSVQQRILLSMITSAAKGNVKAAEWIRDTIGEASPQQIEVEERRPPVVLGTFAMPSSDKD